MPLIDRDERGLRWRRRKTGSQVKPEQYPRQAALAPSATLKSCVSTSATSSGWVAVDGGAMMIGDEVRREGLAVIAVAATILVEDAHEALATAPTAAEPGPALAELLGRLGTDLTALANAAAVLARGD